MDPPGADPSLADTTLADISGFGAPGTVLSWHDESPSTSATMDLAIPVASIKVTPTPFRNDGSIKQWLAKYDAIAKLNGWTDEEKLSYLPVFMDGKAYEIYSSLPANDTTDWKTVVTTLTRIFGVLDNPLLDFERLTHLRQGTRPVRDYANEILHLTAKVN